MLFKPNFCCNCGTKIDRAEWSVLTSRRFCEVCAVEFKSQDWFPRILVISGILVGVFGLGAYMGGEGPTAVTPLKSAETSPSRKIEVGAKQETGIKMREPSPAQGSELLSDPAATANSVGRGETNPSAARSAVNPNVPIHFCGALTKKGTPCSRRVKTKGRCWQHAGKPSALVSQAEPDIY